MFKKVLGILLLIATEDRKLAEKMLDIADHKGGKNNYFDALDVEDLVSDDEDAVPQAVKKKSKSYERVYELDDPSADYFMEIFFFFRDMH